MKRIAVSFLAITAARRASSAAGPKVGRDRRVRPRITLLVAIAAPMFSLLSSIVAPVAAATPAPPFTQCPSVGASASCAILLVVNPDQTITVLTDSTVSPFDGTEDTLVGIQNNSRGTVSAITVSSDVDLASFDGDGLCTFGVTNCPFGPTGYEGPGASFMTQPGDLQDVETDFPGGGLAPSASTYFSLEGALTAAAVTAQEGGLAPDLDGDGIPDALEQQLAEKYAPVLLFAPGEPNYPVNVDWLLHRTSLGYYEECHYVGHQELSAIQGPLDQGDLLSKGKESPACRFSVPSFSPITSIQPDPDAPRYLQATHPACKGWSAVYQPQQAFYLTTVSGGDRTGLTDTSQWTTYFHSYPTSDGGVMLQYWHAFSYNDYQSPFGAGLCDQHGGDWDASVQVQLDSSLGPEKVWFSRHTEDNPGAPRTLSEVRFSDGTHPMVVVDSGGHGAYASPDDFCAYHQVGVNLGTGVWSDAAVATDLHNIECSGDVENASNIKQVGGTVWQTWTGGSVTSTVIGGGQGGPLVNLGEYNPGTETCGSSCAGMTSGTFAPLNGQVFIKYSGLWGDPKQVSGVGFPPRGPVFQGLVSGTNQYASWYNQASHGKWQPPEAGVPLINVTSVRVGNGYATVSWQRTSAAPPSPITSFVVTASPWGNDRVPAPLATPSTQQVGPSDTSASVSGLIVDCHQMYQVAVTPMMGSVAGPAATWDSPVRPSGVVSPTEPQRVVILLDGIKEAKPQETLDPYKPTLDGAPSYCPEAWNSAARTWAESDFAGSPNGPWEFFNKWNFADPGQDAAKTGNSTPRDLTSGLPTHSFMLDASAAQGDIFLPYSYTGASLAQAAGSDPIFTYNSYSSCASTPGCSSKSIADDVDTLNKEIASIHGVWKDTEINLVGHSQGGLIAFEWWLKFGYGAARGSAAAAVAHVFTLDSPVNGVCYSPACLGPPDYPRYDLRIAHDRIRLYEDALSGYPVHFLGTSGDTVPIFLGGGYGPAGKENLQHQLLVTGDKCMDQSNNSDCPSPPDHVSGCPIDSTSPSWIQDDQHFVVKFCPDDVSYFDNVLGLSYP